MKRTFSAFFLTLALLASVTVQAKDSSAALNARITRDYYSSLVAAPAKTAQLTLFMNLIPKGGDLHHHYSGAIYVEHFLDLVEKAGYCIYNENDAANKAEKYRIETRIKQGEQPKNCLSAEAVRRDNGFYRELLKTWSDKDFDNHSHQQLAPDQHFFNTFGYFGPVSGFQTNASLQILKARAKAENLQYLETMLKSAPAVPHAEFAARIDSLAANAGDAEIESALAPYADFMVKDAAAQGAIDSYLKMLEQDAAGIDDSQFTLRFQTYVTRLAQPSRVFSSMVGAFMAAQKSKLLVGVNIVGAENNYVAIRDYALHMKMFRFLKQRYPTVRLALHAGELTLGMVPPEDLRWHIRSAIDVGGAERIGHGVDVNLEDNPDQLLALLRKKDIPVEINLSSNAFILGVKDEAHPVTVYLQHGVPVVLSTDDAGVSRNTMSSEYVLFASRYRPSYATLKKIVANSIRYSFLTTEEKAAQMKELDRRFLAFEARIAEIAKTGRK